ncbi:MAG: hypothetical protein GWP08_04225 [Nitrospiraceae bacterium]|nr:hypothetical protein [Nitrospiraceae bacterium]
MGKTASGKLRQLITDPECGEEDECSVAACLWDAIVDMFCRRGVEQTPIVLLRGDDVVASFLVVRRLERRLVRNDGDCDALEEKKPARNMELQLVEALGRARERLRKAMKELEDSCGKAGTPNEVCIQDQMKPILKKAEGILEDALEFEARKQRRRAAKEKKEAAPKA